MCECQSEPEIRLCWIKNFSKSVYFKKFHIYPQRLLKLLISFYINRHLTNAEQAFRRRQIFSFCAWWKSFDTKSFIYWNKAMKEKACGARFAPV